MQLFTITIMVALLAACPSFQTQASTKPHHYSGDLGYEAALTAFKHSCNTATGTRHALCAIAQTTPSNHAQAFWNKHFVQTKATNAYFTGYYIPEIEASLECNATYAVPIYPLPSPTLQNTFTRQEIETGALNMPPIACAKNKVDFYFLQIQGSGHLRLADGSLMRIGFAGKNGKEYVSIGKKLIEHGIFAKEDMTAESLKDWLKHNPQHQDNIFWQNPSYVFFKPMADAHVIGAQGVPLTGLASVAVDPSFIPHSTPLLVDIVTDQTHIKRIMIAQDSGSAIKGASRMDIFYGLGNQLAQIAGATKHNGTYSLLEPQ